MLTEGSDDQRRLLLALTLSLGLFLGVQYLFGPQQKQTKKEDATAEKSSVKNDGEKSPDRTNSSAPGNEKTEPSDDTESTPSDSTNSTSEKPTGDTSSTNDASNGAADKQQPMEKRQIVLENDELKATFSSHGATLTKLILKDYYRTAEKEDKVHLFDDRFRDDTISFSIRRNTSDKEDLDVDQANWSVVSTPQDRSTPTVTFQHKTPDGLLIEKTFTLPEDRSHMIDYDVRFASPERDRKTGQLKLYSPGGIVLQSKQDQSYHLGLYGYENDGEWTYENDIGPTTFNGGEDVEERDVGGPVWTGLTIKYFASIFIPRNRADLLAYKFEPLRIDEKIASGSRTNSGKKSTNVFHPNRSIISYFVTKGMELEGGEEKTFSFQIYNGPKKESILNEYQEYGLPNLINYGWFGFISGFFIDILGFLYGFIGNYGIAILLLTLAVKLLLHPITKRAQVSMHKMKDLQPKIQELQEKYEDDRQKLGEEQMKLFKEHGVNPLGGCLPMVCQIPVLIGLYYGIRVSFEVRQKPFMLWVNDLSQPDHFMEIGMGQVMGLDFQYLNLLIIFMMATWLIQSLTHPSPGGGGGGGGGQAAMQQKMFKFMPMIFGVICYNFPSGLVLYWMMSTLFSALEQLYIRKIVLPSS